MRRTERFFMNGDGLTKKRLRLAVFALLAIDRRQVVHGRRLAQVLLPEFLRFLESILEQRFGFVRAASLQRRVAGIRLLDEDGAGVRESGDFFQRVRQPVSHGVLSWLRVTG